MKANSIRFIFVSIIIVLLSFVFIYSNNCFNLNNLNYYNLKVFFDYNFQNNNLIVKKNGIGTYVCCDANEFENIKKDYAYSGLSFNSKEPIDVILKKLNAQIVKIQHLTLNNEQKTIFYAYTNLYDKFIVSENKKINVQIIDEKYCCTIGMPVLLGSY